MNRFRLRQVERLLRGPPSTQEAAWRREHEQRWHRTLEAFFTALPEPLHDRVADALGAWLDRDDPSLGGRGLYSWLDAVWVRNGRAPTGMCDPLPAEVVEVYLHEPEAKPTREDCAQCGLLLPVVEPVVESAPDGQGAVITRPGRTFFEACPACGKAPRASIMAPLPICSSCSRSR